MATLYTDRINKDFIGHKALDDISINIPEGNIYGLLGPNGAGKTTLIRIITQIIMADSGVVYIDNRPITPRDIERIGYLPEERGLYKKMKVADQLLYLARLKGISRNDAVDRIRTWLKKLELDEWANKNVQDLSKGMQQKIQFISTIIANPEIIILDEPFSGFDPINADTIKDEILKLRENGATIIFSTHRMESVEELCDNIALINKSKKILEGSKVEIKNSFKSNTYYVEHKGDLVDMPKEFQLIKSEVNGEQIAKSEIMISDGTVGNDLLKYLVNSVQVVAFIEKIPTMNEIFINAVTQERHE
ncbi:MAG: ATP-binding cassette domain-containing protein [Bacteroidetes bacterium]|nr:ATP-binding cassette domain-containing protein [Bacteroidota bacterium]MDA1119208.1 ATP-binding cassette domain-containing protein [Bacteroidota bacterium]